MQGTHLQAFEIERSAASSAKQPSPAVGEKEHAVYVRDMVCLPSAEKCVRHHGDKHHLQPYKHMQMKSFDSGDRERRVLARVVVCKPSCVVSVLSRLG